MWNIFFRNFAIGNQFLISLDSMAGEKGVRLPLTRATETQGAYMTEPAENKIKESPAAKECAVVAERDKEKREGANAGRVQ